MNTTNLLHPFKGSKQWTTADVEGNLLGVETEIQRNKGKLEQAEGKAQAHYQERLGELCQMW